MFELILNAAKIAFSQDIRDGSNALIDTLVRSPEWQKEICTLVAKIPSGEEERFFLLLDVVSQKLDKLTYSNEAISAFRTSTRELVSNVIEHGCQDDLAKQIGVTIEISPTYISTLVSNPKTSKVLLEDWAKKGFLDLQISGKRGRGRGLQLVGQFADIIQQSDPYTIKTIVYRNRVNIVHEVIKGFNLVAVLSGHSNPSLLRRLIPFLEKHGYDDLILCLDPNEFMRFRENPSDLVQDVIDKVPTASSNSSKWAYSRDDMASSVIFMLTTRLQESHKTFRLVLNNAIYLELLADGTAFSRIRDAILSMKSES